MPVSRVIHDAFDRFAVAVEQAAGSPWAFSLALILVIVWAATGPVFGYSETWQLVINTGTTIITFLMVFVIQASANRAARIAERREEALQIKLDELVLRLEGPRDRLAGLEERSDEEIQEAKREVAS